MRKKFNAYKWAKENEKKYPTMTRKEKLLKFIDRIYKAYAPKEDIKDE